jgi:hypothetical protein
MRPPTLAAAFALALAAGCTTALSTMQPADTLPRGGVHVGAGVTVDLPVTQAIRALDEAEDLADAYAADPDYQPTEAEQRDAFEAGLGLALAAPGPTIDLMARYGVIEHLDVGLRYTTSGVHLDGKLQFLERGPWAGSISVGVARGLFQGPVFDVLEYLQIDDFSRWDLEVPLILGRSLGPLGKVWFGPKLVVSRVELDAALANVDSTLALEETLRYVGGFGGLALGYRDILVFAELSVMHLTASAVVLGDQVDLGGLIVVPSGGVMARF